MAFNLIIGQTINLHQLPDLLWGGNYIFHTKKRKKKHNYPLISERSLSSNDEKNISFQNILKKKQKEFKIRVFFPKEEDLGFQEFNLKLKRNPFHFLPQSTKIHLNLIFICKILLQKDNQFSQKKKKHKLAHTRDTHVSPTSHFLLF